MKIKKSGFLGGWFASSNPVTDQAYRTVYTVPSTIDFAVVNIETSDYQMKFAVNGVPLLMINGSYRNIYLKKGEVLSFSKGGSTANYFNVAIWGQELVMTTEDNPYIAVTSSANTTSWSLVYQNPNTWSHLLYPLTQVMMNFYVQMPDSSRFYTSVDRSLGGSNIYDCKVLVPPGGSLYAKFQNSPGTEGVNFRMQGIQLP